MSKKLDQAYIYYDTRTIETNFACVTNTELEQAYTKLTSGTSLRLWLYFLHQVNGRTIHDRNQQRREPFFLGIDRITSDPGITRSAIYKAQKELINKGFLYKKTGSTRSEIFVFLTIPSPQMEIEPLQNQQSTDMLRSSNGDRQIAKNHTTKGNWSKLSDLQMDTTCNTEQNQFPPISPKGDVAKKEDQKIDIAMTETKRQKQQRVMRIAKALTNGNWGYIDIERDMGNILRYISENSYASRRRSDVEEAVKLHNSNLRGIEEAKQHLHAETNAKSKKTAISEPHEPKEAAPEIKKYPISPEIYDCFKKDLQMEYLPWYHDHLISDTYEGMYSDLFRLHPEERQKMIDKLNKAKGDT